MMKIAIIFTHCPKSRQSSALISSLMITLIALLTSFSTQAISFEEMSNEKRLQMLSPYAVFNHRAPANYVPEEELIITPDADHELWINEVMVEDNSGVLREIKRVVQSWDETETYVQAWDLESTGLYQLETTDRKKAYLGKHMLKYLDKRLSGEIKNAEEGSAFHSVGRVHQALRPNTKVQVSENIKVKFKARVLQGKGIMQVDNPYVNYKTVVKLDGRVNMYLDRNFESLGVNSGVEYQVDQGIWMAKIDKKITDHVIGRISSTQSDNLAPFESDSDKRVELFYNYSF